MPIVRVEMWHGRDEEPCPPEAVIVVIDDIPKENWGEAGKQASKS